MTGYASTEYASAFATFGLPIRLRASGSWVLRRSIPNTDYYDAMGLYPLMCCENWPALTDDFERLENLVSLVCVTDPFSGQDLKTLTVDCGFDFARVYKEHVILNPKSPSLSKHHAYYARKATGDVRVEVADDPAPYLDDWCTLYDELVERHQIAGISAFSRASFERQFSVPGLVVFIAKHAGCVVGMHLWFEQGDFAYSHLAASSAEGYKRMVAYALHQAAIDYFNGRIRMLDLGAGAGIDSESDGLLWFKKGWSPDTLPTYLCGKVFRQSVYDSLGGGDGSFFPAYRNPNG